MTKKEKKPTVAAQEVEPVQVLKKKKVAIEAPSSASETAAAQEVEPVQVLKKKKKVAIEAPSSASESDYTSDSESDAVEDEDGELVTPAIDAQILRTLADLRAKDSKIYDPAVKFFDEGELERAEGEWAKKRAATGKRVTLTDFQRERLLSGRLLEDEDEQEQEQEPEETPLTHYEEQEQLKGEFKRALEEDADEEEGEDGLFTVRPRSADQLQREEEDYRSFLLENLSKSQNARESMGDWLSYKADQRQPAPAGAEGTEEKFLIDYVLNRGWIDQEKRSVPDYEKVIREDDEDLEAVEQAEDFEVALNFRFEQPGAEHVITYSRDIEGSMRRTDSKRKTQRESKQVRREAHAKQLEEDLKRKKNKKMKELGMMVDKIRNVANLKKVDQADLGLDDSDFDPEEHDKKMARLFSSTFYDAEDDDKPVFSDDDDDDKLVFADEDKLGLAGNDPLAFAGNDTLVFADNDDCAMTIVEGSKKKKRKAGASSRDLDELYKLDVEDVIGKGEVACRFKYASVLPTSFGLKTQELLDTDDATLNSHVSLKKLAPYRPAEKQQDDIRKYGDKRRVYMFRKKQWDAKALKKAQKSQASE